MRKTIYLILIAQLYLLLPVFAIQSPRHTELLNFDWKFMKGDSIPAFTEWFDDSKWETVQLPHDASIGENFSNKESTSENGWLPYGKGWYRKYFEIPADSKQKKVFISFDGVYRAAEVWCNGVYLGKQLNGYIGFEYDITREIKFGKQNVIAVKYDNTVKGTSRWYTGEGIYRDVWLKITDKLYIPQYGTYITTPVVNKGKALAKVETNVVNEYNERRTCRLVTEIIAPDGKKVTEFTSVVPINSGENYLFHQEIEIPAPMLWSFDTPNIYKAVSKVYADDNQLDEYETTFGIREISMTPDKGLLVNGKKVIAKGGDMHHDLGCIG
ncbi:MAG: beta galactosidase jelly roll domain-containing protein, partial [Peptostreptococcaceae bacterium]|nr:beta galactosidase jelly roll domain-containing protein [Peptostreptococcaceae bacterium]